MRTAIHSFKYESDRRLSEPLADLLHNALRSSIAWKGLVSMPPVLVPVPLHPKREKARGFNQCFLLARDLASFTGWQVDNRLQRTRETESQVGLDIEKRRRNVRDAFEWQGENVPERVVLVDDVCTTGATMSECALALAEAGTKRVYVATVARARGSQNNTDV